MVSKNLSEIEVTYCNRKTSNFRMEKTCRHHFHPVTKVHMICNRETKVLGHPIGSTRRTQLHFCDALLKNT